jgi:hypothetical protein
MDHTSVVFGSSISLPSLTTESPEVYNSDAQSPFYGSLDDIGTFGGNSDQDIDGNMYHTSIAFGSSQYLASLAAGSSEGYSSDARCLISDDYGTFGGNSDRDSDGNMDDDDAAEDDDEHVIDDDVFNAVVHHEIAQNAANERERGELLNPESCRSAVNGGRGSWNRCRRCLRKKRRRMRRALAASLGSQAGARGCRLPSPGSAHLQP